jgi:hypothetical protein
LIIKDGAKMSKSREMINPDIYKKYVDSVRCYLLFFIINQGGIFDTALRECRFIKRADLFATRDYIEGEYSEIFRHQTIKEITEELEHLRLILIGLMS